MFCDSWYHESLDLEKDTLKKTKTWNLTYKQKNNMLRTGQWYYCKKNTEWERYQVRDYVVPKFYSIT